MQCSTSATKHTNRCTDRDENGRRQRETGELDLENQRSLPPSSLAPLSVFGISPTSFVPDVAITWYLKDLITAAALISLEKYQKHEGKSKINTLLKRDLTSDSV